MKWPWMSRETLNTWKYCYDSAIAANTYLQTQNTDLLEKYHALKLQGAAVPEEPQKLAPTNMDPVMCAITAKAGPDRKLRAMMSREAMQSRAAGIPDIEIIQAIEQGVTVDEEAVL